MVYLYCNFSEGIEFQLLLHIKTFNKKHMGSLIEMCLLHKTAVIWVIFDQWISLKQGGMKQSGETTVGRYMKSSRPQASHLQDCKAINSFCCVLLVWETTCESVQHEINYY